MRQENCCWNVLLEHYQVKIIMVNELLISNKNVI
jgi:hypothetical protein